MNQLKLNQWLEERKLALGESFIFALKKYANEYRNAKGYNNLERVYEELGIRKQTISYWSKYPYQTQTKNFSI